MARKSRRAADSAGNVAALVVQTSPLETLRPLDSGAPLPSRKEADVHRTTVKPPLLSAPPIEPPPSQSPDEIWETALDGRAAVSHLAHGDAVLQALINSTVAEPQIRFRVVHCACGGKAHHVGRCRLDSKRLGLQGLSVCEKCGNRWYQ